MRRCSRLSTATGRGRPGVREQEAGRLWGRLLVELRRAAQARAGVGSAPPPRRRLGVGLLYDNCPEWVVVEQACRAWIGLDCRCGSRWASTTSKSCSPIRASPWCGERWTGAFSARRAVEAAGGAADRPAERLLYEELRSTGRSTGATKGSGRTALKLYDLPFVEQMGSAAADAVPAPPRRRCDDRLPLAPRRHCVGRGWPRRISSRRSARCGSRRAPS